MKRIALLLLCFVPVFVIGARKLTWVIDPGHGGHDVGCEGRVANEKGICLDVAKEVGRLVKKHIKGVRVVYTRERDTYPTLAERCALANARGAALFISIHVNSAPNQYVRGTESFYATNVPLSGTQAGKSELLALLLQRQYLAHGREISRGVKQRELYVCENTNMPSVLTEIGFITNPTEEAYLVSKAGQKELADAIYMALAEYAELTKDGTVDKKQLRNLRYSHYAPLSITKQQPKTEIVCEPIAEATSQAQAQAAKVEAAQEAIEVAKDNKAKAEAKAEAARIAKIEEEARLAAEREAKLKAEQELARKAKEAEQQKAESAAAAKQSGAETKETANEKAEPTDKPYFAIQLMNTASKLKEGDYRLKGFKGVSYLAAGDRFKVLFGRWTDYQVAKNELSQVRETFPEAFIVAFLGDKQITTSEALNMKK